MTLLLEELRAANANRQKEWDPEGKVTPSFRGLELGGEVGEALNVVKKLERERLGIKGSRTTKDDLAGELADVVICADLCALDHSIDLSAAIRHKFNATSDKVGLSSRLEGDVYRAAREENEELRQEAANLGHQLEETRAACTDLEQKYLALRQDYNDDTATLERVRGQRDKLNERMEGAAGLVRKLLPSASDYERELTEILDVLVGE